MQAVGNNADEYGQHHQRCTYRVVEVDGVFTASLIAGKLCGAYIQRYGAALKSQRPGFASIRGIVVCSSSCAGPATTCIHLRADVNIYACNCITRGRRSQNEKYTNGAVEALRSCARHGQPGCLVTS
eukprot:541731-Amphidinium_carterae.3